MSSTFTPSRYSSSNRFQSTSGVSRFRSWSLKKPPEPLKKAVADCLSSSSHAYYGPSSSLVPETSRTLLEYIASSTTVDIAYNVILEHTMAERWRSPAVVSRCVSLLKRHLVRYKPSDETLLQIDRFCVCIIVECSYGSSSHMSCSLHQQTGTSSDAANDSLPVSTFASPALVKSISFVRSLLAVYIPKRLSETTSFDGTSFGSKHPLPKLYSLNKPFDSNLMFENGGDLSVKKDDSVFPSLQMSEIGRFDGTKDVEYLTLDVLNWRWHGQGTSFVFAEGKSILNSQNVGSRNFIDVGAAALLINGMEENLKERPLEHHRTDDMLSLDLMFQPSVTTASNSTSAGPHLKAVIASKRCKQGPDQIWEEPFVNTFHPCARQLFQYRHYSEQQPLCLNNDEVGEVISAVCSGVILPGVNQATFSSRLNKSSGKQLTDVAASVLIKLVIDMYVLNSRIAAPLTLTLLEEMIRLPRSTSRARAFDFIINLGVHAHLLEPVMVVDASTLEEEYSQNSFLDSKYQNVRRHDERTNSFKKDASSAVGEFELWILGILNDTLLLLVHIEEKEEPVWASAFSCLLYFVCDRGKISRSRLTGLDIRVIKILLDIGRQNSWAEVVHTKLICMLTNMFYHVEEYGYPNTNGSKFMVERIDLIGGMGFIFLEYSLSNSRAERRNLYAVLFDYALHKVNKDCVVNGVSEYTHDEIQHIATLLSLADASEAFYISVKLGIGGIGGILRRSISHSLSGCPNSQRLSMLLENITQILDKIIRSFTHLDTEFTDMLEMTKSFTFFSTVEDGVLTNAIPQKVKSSWITLHYLLHSDRIYYRKNAYMWLSDLLVTEVSRDANILSNIKDMHQQIDVVGIQDFSAASNVPLPIWLFCGLLKSKHGFVRWGFLYVLEVLLMRCKFLLDGNDLTKHSGKNERSQHFYGENNLEKANVIIDIMSKALSLVAQINEIDRLNILKMCDILFCQLCHKVPPASLIQPRNDSQVLDQERSLFQQNNSNIQGASDKIDSKNSIGGRKISETAPLAALLLQGQAITPIQLVSRVPAALFYWPLIQLADAATDNVALGVSVGSKGQGNLPGATSDIRATLLLLLFGKCTVDPAAFQEVGGEDFFRELLDDTDSRVAYYSAAFLLKRMMTKEPEKYQRMLQNLIFKAQQSNNEKLLENPYLQLRGMLHLSTFLCSGL